MELSMMEGEMRTASVSMAIAFTIVGCAAVLYYAYKGFMVALLRFWNYRVHVRKIYIVSWYLFGNLVMWGASVLYPKGMVPFLFFWSLVMSYLLRPIPVKVKRHE